MVLRITVGGVAGEAFCVGGQRHNVSGRMLRRHGANVSTVSGGRQTARQIVVSWASG
jgi:hypothetical protein